MAAVAMAAVTMNPGLTTLSRALVLELLLLAGGSAVVQTPAYRTSSCSPRPSIPPHNNQSIITLFTHPTTLTSPRSSGLMGVEGS